MKTYSVNRLPALLALLAAAFMFAFLAAGLVVSKGVDKAEAKKSKKKKAGWQRKGKVFTDVGYANLDVVKLDDGRYRAYIMSKGTVISAISSDAKSYTLESGTRMLQADHMVLVKLTDGSLRMYFNNRSAERGETGVMMSATSTNGLDFTVDPGVRLRPGASGEPDSGGIIHPSVMQDPSGKYHMYYDADGGSSGNEVNWNGVMSAQSADGLTWTKDSGFRIKPGMANLNNANMVWSPFARYKSGRYQVYFGTESENLKKLGGIYLATSKNGLSFKVSKKAELGMDPKVKKPQQGPGGSTGLPQDPFIVTVAGGELMYYWQAQQGTFYAVKK